VRACVDLEVAASPGAVPAAAGEVEVQVAHSGVVLANAGVDREVVGGVVNGVVLEGVVDRLVLVEGVIRVVRVVVVERVLDVDVDIGVGGVVRVVVVRVGVRLVVADVAVNVVADVVVLDVDVGVAHLVIGDNRVVLDVRVPDVFDTQIPLETENVQVVFYSHDDFLCS
jgi:hypothetical protein